MKHTMTMIACAALMLVLGSKGFANEFSSDKLVSKAWDAMGAGKLDEALKTIEMCEKLYGVQAKKMQEELEAYPKGKDETFKYWALNDVGTCLFIKGEVLLKKGAKKDAIEAYKKCAKDYKFCQCYDPKGWFWKPGEAAKKKVVELSLE